MCVGKLAYPASGSLTFLSNAPSGHKGSSSTFLNLIQQRDLPERALSSGRLPSTDAQSIARGGIYSFSLVPRQVRHDDMTSIVDPDKPIALTWSETLRCHIVSTAFPPIHYPQWHVVHNAC